MFTNISTPTGNNAYHQFNGEDLVCPSSLQQKPFLYLPLIILVITQAPDQQTILDMQYLQLSVLIKQIQVLLKNVSLVMAYLEEVKPL